MLIKTDAENTWNKQGMIVTSDAGNCTYLMNLPAGVLQRNCKHLQPLLSPHKTFVPDPPLQSPPTSDSKDIRDLRDIVEDLKDLSSKAITLPDTSNRRLTQACKPLCFREEEVY